MDLPEADVSWSGLIRLEKHVHEQPSITMKQTSSWLVTVREGSPTSAALRPCDSRRVVVEPVLDLLGPLFVGPLERFLLPRALVGGKRGG